MKRTVEKNTISSRPLFQKEFRVINVSKTHDMRNEMTASKQRET